MRRLLQMLAAVPLILIAPLLVIVPAIALAFLDMFWALLGRRRAPQSSRPRTQAASVVIPNWNGRDLLQKYLPSVVEALKGDPVNEIIVVDNGSTDGSAEFVRRQFPSVRVIALDKNLGFGGGSNTGFREARNDVVVLLNSDMRVDAGFLAPLLDGFTDENVFAVSCQIFFSDPARPREETGLTQGWWQDGGLRVRHRIDDEIRRAYPCFYGGGGSCAFDRRKFLELGGFDHLLAPFYLEDTDLGYQAWKRGWKVLFEPQSIVWHEHRGTIGKTFSREYIDTILRKNFLLFTWKNIQDWTMLAEHFSFALTGSILSSLFGDSLERTSVAGLWRAVAQLPAALSSRWQAHSLAVVDDREALRRPLGGYYRDRFQTLPHDPRKLSVLMVSPYTLLPPVHGGAVFMSQTAAELSSLCDLNLIACLDSPEEEAAHAPLVERCRSAHFLVRVTGDPPQIGAIAPHAVREFHNRDLEWMIHRTLLLDEVDVLQIEYANMGQYAGDFRQIVCSIFEHDIYFQSVWRILQRPGVGLAKVSTAFEYLRALRYELTMLRRMDQVQMCTSDNRDYLLSYAPDLSARVASGLRAGIDAATYSFAADDREPDTMLFVGSFRHLPNTEALMWLVHRVMPQIFAKRPQSRFVVVGSDPPPLHGLPDFGDRLELRGFVEEVREPLGRYSVFLCPILTGSGVRVKLLEAFACGIPSVSTTLGAEGLARVDGEFCRLADDPGAFADAVMELLDHREAARAMALRARAEVEENWNMPRITRRLYDTLLDVVRRKRG